MKIEIENQEKLNLLGRKNELVEKNLELLKEMEVIEKEHNKNVSLLKRLDEKVRPKITKIIPPLGEYEQLSRVHNEKGKWYLEITDRLEEFKTAFKSGK